MSELKEIESLEDIRLMVDTFYGKVRKDDLLADIFDSVIQNRWPEHLEKMYRFWQTVLLDEHTYQGAPFVPHAYLPVDKQHFNRWLELFYGTVDTYFIGQAARRAKLQGLRMAEMFLLKINHIRAQSINQVQ